MQEQSATQYIEYTDLCCERVHGPRMDGGIIHDRQVLHQRMPSATGGLGHTGVVICVAMEACTSPDDATDTASSMSGHERRCNVKR